MNGRETRLAGDVDPPTIEELLDRAIEAVNHGDRASASRLAEKVLAVDRDNADAEDLLSAPADGGEIRRLTIMFADLVDSTVLSTRIEPEIYRTVVGRYREHVRQSVERYEGHIASTKGDGLLAVFGHPRPHEDDARRAVRAGLEITRDVARLSDRVRQQFGFEIDVRVGIHRGLVYLDIVQDDVYGLAANLAARVSGLAPPGTVVVSNAIEQLVRDEFEVEGRPSQHVKGIEDPVEHHLVLGERTYTARTVVGPVVGRQRELSELQQRWSEALAGTLSRPGIAFVGEAGMGKSRLAVAAADLAEDSGHTVLALLGSPFHTDAGLHPMRGLLERRCHIGRTTTQAERLHLLEAELRVRAMDPVIVVPLLAPVLGIAPETGYAPAAEGRKLYSRIRAALVDYLLACLGGRPGVIVIEDLQWFDPSTVDLVRSLLNRETGRLLVVLTARDGSLPPDLPGVTVFDLPPLTATETDQLIDGLDPSLSAGQRAEVRRRGDGVPLYIEEIVTKHDPQASDSTQWARVPDALYEPLFARLRASKNAVPVVAAAATIGRDIDRNLLAAVVDMLDDEIADAIAELERTRVLTSTGPDSWRFRHELLREVAAELAPPSQRRRLHGRVADALELSGAGQPDWNLIALHCEHAERFDQAAAASQRASSEARRRGALFEARNHLSRTIANIEKMPAGQLRNARETAARVRRGFLTSSTAGPGSAEAVADFERCLQLSGSELNEGVMATMQALFGYYISRGNLRRAEQLLESGRLLSAGGPEWMVQANLVGFATTAWYGGDFTSARAQLEELAATHSKADGRDIDALWFVPHEPVASTYTVLALARFAQGDLAGMESGLADAESRCATLGFPHGPFSLAYSHSVEMWMRYECGQLDRSSDCVAALDTISRKYGFDSWRGVAAAEQALVDAVILLAQDALEPEVLDLQTANLTAFVQAMAAVDVKPFLSVYYAVIARLHLAADRPDHAREQLDTALLLNDELGIRFYEAELLRLRAHTSTGQDRLSALAEALELAQNQGAAVFQLRTAIDIFEFTGSEARETLFDALRLIPDGNPWPEVTRAQALLA